MCGTAKKLQVCSVSIDWWPRYTVHEIVIEGAYRAELPKNRIMPHAVLFDYGQKIQTEALPKSVSALRRRSALSASPDMRWSSFYASAGGNRAGEDRNLERL
jgi:hypothetical protein